MTQISAAELSAWLAASDEPKPVLLDVREPWEFHTCRLPASLHVPMRTLPARINELERDADTVVICHHGARSMQVGYFLEHQGFTRVHNLAGGVDDGARPVDPPKPAYYN